MSSVNFYGWSKIAHSWQLWAHVGAADLWRPPFFLGLHVHQNYLPFSWPAIYFGILSRYRYDRLSAIWNARVGQCPPTLSGEPVDAGAASPPLALLTSRESCTSALPTKGRLNRRDNNKHKRNHDDSSVKRISYGPLVWTLTVLLKGSTLQAPVLKMVGNGAVMDV